MPSPTADALRDTLISPNESDRNLESANVVDGLFALARAADAISAAIFPRNTLPGHDAGGGTVDSLTEAAMGITAGLHRIAESIENLADAVRGRGDGQQ
jgi:hypothetical protein